jgi:NDP-sugar pyrophosphorylase family protein
MKAMILAAGFGTRLRPLTCEIAKPAIPLLNKPLIGHVLNRLAGQGCSDFMINLHHLPDTVKTAVDEYSGSYVISYSIEEFILGTAGGLRKNKDFFHEDVFIMSNADIIPDFSILDALKFHMERRPLATLLIYPQIEPYLYTPIRIDENNRIYGFKGIEPRVKLLDQTYVFTGIHIMEKRIFDYIPESGFSEINSEVYPQAIRSGEEVCGFPVSGYWNDLGDPRRYLEAHLELIQKVSGPSVLVGDHSIVEPTVECHGVSIGRNCIIGRNCRIENSILWDDVMIQDGSEINNCIIGNGIKVQGHLINMVVTTNGSVQIS